MKKKATHEDVALAFVRNHYARNDRLTSNGGALWLGTAGVIGARTSEGLIVIAEWPGRSASIVKTSLRRAAYHAEQYAVIRFSGLGALPSRPVELLDAWNREIAERAAIGLPPFILKGAGDAMHGVIDLMEALKASLGKSPQRPATAQTPVNPSPDIGGKTPRPPRAVRAPERPRVVKWVVPICYQGKEIDGLIVNARTDDDARAMAQPEYVGRGYSDAAGYSIGKPYTDEAL